MQPQYQTEAILEHHVAGRIYTVKLANVNTLSACYAIAAVHAGHELACDSLGYVE